MELAAEAEKPILLQIAVKTMLERMHLSPALPGDRLLKRGPAPPPVYQGQFDPKGVWTAFKVFLGLGP
jgi:hypothetical protein